jgi:predicted benzoate:H+ symporter BenE
MPRIDPWELAATALVTSEGHPVKYPASRAVGAFLLMAYWVIGAGVLRPRLLGLRDAALGDPVHVD